MVDPKFDNHDNFVINEKYHDEEVQELDREDYYDDHSGIFRKKYLNPIYHRGYRINCHRYPFYHLFSRPQRYRRQQADGIP